MLYFLGVIAALVDVVVAVEVALTADTLSQLYGTNTAPPPEW